MNQVNFIKDRLSPRRRTSAYARVVSIIHRYGLSEQKLYHAIFQFTQLARRYDAVPTFPITASLLEKYAALIRQLQAVGARFAIHGYQHIDYTFLTESEFRNHLQNSIQLFQENGIAFSGFRFPYLKRAPQFLNILGQSKIAWDSSDACVHQPLARAAFTDANWQAFEYMLEDYQSAALMTQRGMPHLTNELVELPVALPDDDLLIDRLRVSDKQIVTKCWTKMLETTFERGELFVLQLHPERFFLCRDALESVLRSVRQMRPAVWLASLDELSDWWREKINYQFKVRQISDSKYHVTVERNPRASVVIKNLAHGNNRYRFYKNYVQERRHQFEIESPVKPIIGISPFLDLKIQEYLKNEGFAFEMIRPSAKYSVQLDSDNLDQGFNETAIQKAINATIYPLLRIWRWPLNARCAFSISGDIDCLTCWDFFNRFREN
jgi:peptidoglycan/xylan/chitin deacetylase (PgdA/CDA1 family)